MMSTVFLCVGWSLFVITFIVSIRLYIANRQLRMALQMEHDDYRNTLRKQQGMTYKFLKDGSHFVHTFCEGELVTKLGSTPQEIVGKTLQQFIDDKKYVGYKESFYQRAWQGEEVSFEGRMNGVYYIASLRPVMKDHEVVEVIASCVDITQLKLVENDLRKSEQMYRLIAESSTDLIRILETDMTIRYASPSHEQVLGYLPTELEGICCSELIVPEEREHVAQAFRDMIRRQDHHYQLNFHAQHKNGTSIMFETHGKPIHDGNGQIAGVVVVSRDLTNRMKEDEENRRRDKLTLAGQLAAGIAHEIRNPLAAIKGFTELLKIPSERQPFYTEVILAELARVEAIVNEFLLLAKPEATQYQQHDLYAIMTDVVTLLGPQAIMQRVQLQMSAMSERPVVYGAASQLKQVFINILKNAIESMPTGGNVHLTIATDGNTVTVRIQDEGSGIKEEWLQRLGEPFYTTKEKGTGLGLMVSFKIVRDHGGNIAVQSSGAQGTCIEITLPVVQEAVATIVSQHSSMS